MTKIVKMTLEHAGLSDEGRPIARVILQDLDPRTGYLSIVDIAEGDSVADVIAALEIDCGHTLPSSFYYEGHEARPDEAGTVEIMECLLSNPRGWWAEECERKAAQGAGI